MKLTCIHIEDGLCPKCKAEYDEDPDAWIEFGDHPQGIANWLALEEEIRRDMERPSMPVDMADIPF